jgi:hypothetical protein
VSNRQKRKHRQRAAGAQPRPPSRSEQKDAEARATLVPLAPGERPTAVTVGAIVALVFGLSNVVLFAAGVEIGDRNPNAGDLGFGVLMLVAAWGMWNARYWAVLGMQAILGLIIVAFSIFAAVSATGWGIAIAVAVIAGAGTLFWFMVKAMARIQMPTRDQ